MGIYAALIAAALFARHGAVPQEHRGVFELVGRETGVPPNLLHAIAWQESRLNASAVSPRNRDGTRDYGIMQINETNFSRLGLAGANVYDPLVNVRAGARLLSELRRRGLPLSDVVSIYNAGERAGRARRTPTGGYVNAGYVRAVLARYALVTLAFPLAAVS